ncbi:MAG TPA: hypothetical protein VEC14_08760 [Reyranellaceae bacterium]|nr:hypothetical protein [Reyranellaceae bacterium]
MAPLIPIALSLAAEFAPSMIRLFAGDKAADVAGQVLDTARRVTGTSNESEAAAALRANPELLWRFRQDMAVIELETERAYLADRQDARRRDVALAQAGRRNWRADIMVLSAAGGLIACILAIMNFRNQMPPEAVGLISTVAGIFGACLKDAFSFEFGSSRSSRDKDAILAKLTS